MNIIPALRDIFRIKKQNKKRNCKQTITIVNIIQIINQYHITFDIINQTIDIILC